MIIKVPRLKKCCEMSIIHCLLSTHCHNKASFQAHALLLNQLDNGTWGLESMKLLENVLNQAGKNLHSNVILSLLPDFAKELKLKECSALEAQDINLILERCEQLKTLDLSMNSHLAFNNIQLFRGIYLNSNLTSVSLQDCTEVMDHHVQALLRNAPNLQHLNISWCSITDQVFLLDEQAQFAREACLQSERVDLTTYTCKLQSVLVIGCSSFTSTGVRHLCSLCGPTLQSIDLVMTKVDADAFLYLSGMGLPCVANYLMNMDCVFNDSQLSLQLYQLDVVCRKIMLISNGDTDPVEEIPLTLNDVVFSKADELVLNPKDIHLEESKPLDNTRESQSALEKLTSLIDSLSNVSAATRLNLSNSNYEENNFFFQSNLNTLKISANVFQDEAIGCKCFQKFQKLLKNLVSLTITSGIGHDFMSDIVLDLIGTYARGLEELCLHGGDHLTDEGLTEIIDKCHKLKLLDLSGVSFIGDKGVNRIVKSLPLTCIKLAETQISSQCLRCITEGPAPNQLKEVDFSWCEGIESSTEWDLFLASCKHLEKINLRECCISNDTLVSLSQHSHRLTHLSLASNMNLIRDDGLIPVLQNLPLLTSIDLGWDSYLTNKSIVTLLSYCPLLVNANLEGLKLITSDPFMSLISVPESLKQYLKERESCSADKDLPIEFELCDLPCLPHRSTLHSTNLQTVNLTYCDFIEDSNIQQIVTITHNAIQILDYYGMPVEPSKSSLELYLQYLDI